VVSEKVTIHTPSGDFQSRIGGFIDRLDSKDDILRIVDYKTGGSPDMPPSVESLFIPDKKRSGHVFQTFLYASIVSKMQNLKVAPSLLYIHKAASEDYSPVICIKEARKEAEPITDFSIYEEDFRERIQRLLDEIFHPDIDFTQTEIEEKCSYCIFKAFCRK
jgi:ATP-dependent helicase/DNAse subunit B